MDSNYMNNNYMNSNHANPSKQHAKRVIIVYGIGILVFFITTNTPLSIPCLFKFATGIPSPGCGLTRAFVLASQFDFIGAVTMNILFLPISVGMAVYLACALADYFADKQSIRRLNSLLAKKWIITLAVMLTAVSWYYNIVRGI